MRIEHLPCHPESGGVPSDALQPAIRGPSTSQLVSQQEVHADALNSTDELIKNKSYPTMS